METKLLKLGSNKMRTADLPSSTTVTLAVVRVENAVGVVERLSRQNSAELIEPETERIL